MKTRFYHYMSCLSKKPRYQKETEREREGESERARERESERARETERQRQKRVLYSKWRY